MSDIIQLIFSESNSESIEDIKSILSKNIDIKILDAFYKTYFNKNKIISIFSPKGGVGKSMLAANLAIAIKKITKEKVALLDLDMQFGDISLFMNSYSERTLHDLIYNIDYVDSQQLEEYLTEHESGVKMLAAPHEYQYEKKVTKDIIEKVLCLFESYNFVLIDTSSVLNEMNLSVLENSNHILLITTLELTSIKNTMTMLNIMNKNDFLKNKIDFILNRYEKSSGITIDDLKNIIGDRKLHIIPEDKNCVIHSINSGKPITMDIKKADIYKSIMKIGESIVKSDIRGILERWKEFDERDKKAAMF